MQRCRDTRMEVTGLQGYRDRGPQRYRDAEIGVYRSTVRWHRETWLHDYRNAEKRAKRKEKWEGES